ncbi:hypothetical protein ABL78_1363 [Leptomonas seymouri]|uniref:Uncharacterized protein n=1 Tax=Leptomonas seymouri TaxID=5684 RepID=A0A0N0P8G1_LEPSE|nr:hypothetical protein ABL78_1363 [Leptomonas seymouri]|eukprot:KPI89487.1 hypothetical protein ABL78_1363 [Leptomonas seymouri]
MPPKRPLRRPPGPAAPSRTALHTQELILFSSPIVSATAKRTPSTNRGTSGPLAAAPPPSSKCRSSSQRSRAPPGASSSSVPSSSTAKRRSVPEYEPLSEHHHVVQCTPKSFSSKVIPAASSLHGGRVPSPPPSNSDDCNGSRGGGGIVASGPSSRVVRLLRDARAAVQDPICPETPLYSFNDSRGTAAVGAQAANGGVGGGAGSSKHLPHSLEPRLRRRLPAGGRLAPMPPASSASSVGPQNSPPSTLLLQGPSSLSPSATGLSLQTDLRARSYDRAASPPAMAAAASSPTTANGDGGLDAASFAELYAAAQQRGEDGLMDCVNLLGQLKQWLAATSVVAPCKLSAAATACLQTTLLYFCEHWPTGAALRHAVDRYSALNSDSFDVSLTCDGKQLTRSLSSSVPLNYAEVALLAAAVMLRSYPPSSLIAEPISFHALLTALHTIAECGVAEWIAQESQVLEILTGLLQVLTKTQRSNAVSADVTCKYQQWTQWTLEIFVYCFEEASLAATASAADMGSQAAGPHTSRLGAHADVDAQDMIRGHGFADDVTDTTTQSQSWVTSTPLMSSTASLHCTARNPASRPSSHSPISASHIPHGSPLSLLRHGGSGGGGQQPEQTPLNSLKALTTHLLSFGLLTSLQELSADAIQQRTAAAAATSLPTLSLLPVVASLYRLLAQCHAESLRSSGVLQTLVSMLQRWADDSATVESAARSLVKLSFDDECLHSMQEMGATLLDAAAHALLTQMRLHNHSATRAPIEILVSRLCGVVARVAEGSTALQEHLATPAMTHVLEVLAQRYLAGAGTTDGTADSCESPQLPPTPVLQAVVWVLGIAAVSPKCSLHLVESVTPLLVSLLQRLRELPSMQTTAVYVLMCLSNLSYFFNRFELLGDVAEGEERREVSAHAEWLSTICSALCFCLAAYLIEDNVEATVEATRILGNISYTNAGRDWMEENRCDEVIVIFLGHEDLRIVYNCCGILLNLTAASPCRVVEEPELLQMMLSYTARYTKDESIDAAAALEKERLRQQRLLASGIKGTGEQAKAEEACAAEASSSASQIADLVEKLLHNVKGLLSLTGLTTATAGI